MKISNRIGHWFAGGEERLDFVSMMPIFKSRKERDQQEGKKNDTPEETLEKGGNEKEAPETYSAINTSGSSTNGSNSASSSAAQSSSSWKLIFCLLIDLIGMSSEFVPFWGQLTDIAYAPFASWALWMLFRKSKVVAIIEFTEEILPYTDILPLGTICWLLETKAPTGVITRLLGIGGETTTKKKTEWVPLLPIARKLIVVVA